jgi:hypothetical protein
MDRQRRRWSLEHTVVVAAIAVGVAAGSYGVASAANGSSSSSGSGSGSSFGSGLAAAPSAQHPWGPQRSDETPLTGDAAAKVRELALAKVPGGTIVRVETDADGHAAYEAHMVRSDGSPVTVYVSKAFAVVGVQSGMPGPPSGARLAPSGASY